MIPAHAGMRLEVRPAPSGRAVTAQGHPRAIFTRAIKRGKLGRR
jgi:hypothetical protein